MTRWMVFAFIFTIVFIKNSPPVFADNIVGNEVFYLYQSWYENNQVLSWENIQIDFSENQPQGRLALAELLPDQSQGINQDVLGNIIKWQFLDNQPIELLSVEVSVSNQEEKSLSVYLNTDGKWQPVSYQKLSSEKVRFHIQSMSGKFAVATSEPSTETNEFYELPVDAATVVKGYTFDTPDGNIRIGFMPDLVNKPFTAKVRSLHNYPGALDLPDNLNFASDIYHIWLDSDEPLDLKKPIPVQIKFLEGNDELKNIYYYDPSTSTWNLSPSTTLYDLDSVRTLTYNQEYILAVVADPAIKEKGKASWFSSSITPRNPWGSANNDYPIGTIVRVTNLENNKYYDTEIISRGPYVDFRIIDLTSNAFKQIANLGEGVVDVKVEPLDMIIK